MLDVAEEVFVAELHCLAIVAGVLAELVEEVGGFDGSKTGFLVEVAGLSQIGFVVGLF